MTTIDVFQCVTSGHSDPCGNELGVGDIAVEIASIDMRAEVAGNDGEWPESTATDPDHVQLDAIKWREWIHRGNEHVVAQRHGWSIAHQPRFIGWCSVSTRCIVSDMDRRIQQHRR